MSHASGEIWSPSGELLGYFEYNGTVDCVCTRVYPTFEQMDENWHADNSRTCTCGGESSPVILYTTYGPGFHWPGKACFKCSAITDGTFEWEGEEDGHPFRE
jgi:hypothetical protein